MSHAPSPVRSPATALGHVHLEVSDLERSLRFYRSLLGLELVERAGRFAFLSAGERHHDLALQELPGPRRPTPARPGRAPGLYHVAFEVANEPAFRAALERARALGAEPSAVDHGISWALYLADPDGIGVEIYLDRRDAPGGAARWHGSSRPLRL